MSAGSPAPTQPPRPEAEAPAETPALVAEELALLERTAALLVRPAPDARPSEAPLVEELLRLREELQDAKGEDRGSLLEQWHAHLSLLEQLRATDDRPQVDPRSPYFAHLRLRELRDGEQRERHIFLGKATRIEGGLRIVDWRDAPISRLFYQYRQGDTYEEPFGGRLVEGEVVARRTVTIRDAELRAVQAPEGVFQREGEGWRQRSTAAPRLAGGAGNALHWHHLRGRDTAADKPGARGRGDRRLGSDRRGQGRRRDKHLPDIAGLIDPEQFELITRPEGFVVIRGSAGSGKTTVALHRIAWLAHGDGRINSGRTLFLVFSKALRDYVSHVLPALGVGEVNIRTFRDWAGFQRRQHLRNLPGEHRHDTPAVVVAFKCHPAAMQALEWQIERTPGPRTPAQVVEDWANALSNPTLLAAAVEATRSTPDGAPVFSADELERVARWCALQHAELLEWQDAREGRRGGQGSGHGGQGSDGFGAGGGRSKQCFDEEDDSLLLFAWQRRVGPLQGRKRRPLRLLHVAIDEVQDFSPVDVRVVLGCLDRRESITLAGDTQQHVMKDAGFTSWSDFFGHLGVQGAAVETLRISYRCTQQVVSFAMGVLGPLREDDLPLVTREGPEVELFPFTDHGACVAFLADALHALREAEPEANVAVLTPSRALSDLMFQGLERSDVPRLRQVKRQDFAFAPGVEVTEVAEVKGLEFDYVVLVEVSAGHYPVTDAARRRLHVGATRAIHQLWLTSVAPFSPLVTALSDAGPALADGAP